MTCQPTSYIYSLKRHQVWFATQKVERLVLEEPKKEGIHSDISSQFRSPDTPQIPYFATNTRRPHA